MSADDRSPESGGDLLARLSNEMVKAQKEFFGKGPEQAKAYFLDDLLFIVMRGGLTRAEETMIAFGQQDQVRQFRQLFENQMTERLIGMVEEVTGRKVLTYQSQILFGPAIVVEAFAFDERGREAAIEATASGQLEDDGTGEAEPAAGLEGGEPA